MGGRHTFGGDSWGYTASRASVAGAAGSNVRSRFHLGTDGLFDEYGWFIDDIRIFRCFQRVATRNLNVAYNGTSNLYKAANSIAVLTRQGAPLGSCYGAAVAANSLRQSRSESRQSGSRTPNVSRVASQSSTE